jgi:hypothetical protein
MRTFKLIIPVIAFAAFTFTSCHKKETVEVDNETQSVVDNAVAEQEFMSIVPAVNGVAIKTKGTGADKDRVMAACDSLRIVSGDTLWSAPNHVAPTYSLSFGSSTCSPIPDAKLREGVIFITFYGKAKTSGSRMKFVMQNYKAANVDPSKKISYICDSIVVRTISNNPTTDIRLFNVKIYNGKCLGPTNNWTTLYSTDRYIEHNMNNDDVKIWGTSNGTNREGRKFNVTVDQATPLTKHANCQFISFGILKLTPEGFKERTVDYTSGKGVDTCDDDATFSVNGNTIAFKLK